MWDIHISRCLESLVPSSKCLYSVVGVFTPTENHWSYSNHLLFQTRSLRLQEGIDTCYFDCLLTPSPPSARDHDGKCLVSKQDSTSTTFIRFISSFAYTPYFFPFPLPLSSPMPNPLASPVGCKSNKCLLSIPSLHSCPTTTYSSHSSQKKLKKK